jgi:hypothetical protein
MGPHIVGAARQLDTVETGHHDVGEKQIDGMLVHEAERRFAVAVIADLVAGTAQRASKEEAQIFVVFGKENSGHDTSAKKDLGQVNGRK